MTANKRNNANFYRDLPVISSFAEATQGSLHAYVPRDWWIVVADVAGSTQAIEAGNYKKVNTVGVACIAAVVNVDRTIDLPFIFGGDGATFAIPDSLREGVIKALRASQQLAKESFGLTLRVGLVRVAELVTENYWLRLGKVQLSSYVTQPVLSGRGWEEAERRVKKSNAVGVVRVIESEGIAEGSFEGFECRWQNVPSFQEHKLALLVAATAKEADVNFVTYQNVLDKIQTIYGNVEQYHPLRADRMQLSIDPKLLSHEWHVRSAHLSIGQRLQYFAKMLLMNAAGRYLFANNKDTEAVKWSNYRNDMVENSDFRKFDGMLRMVMDGKNTQAEALQAYLEAEYQAGRLVYGMHKSREALVTCIVESYNGNHLHFVDGSDGGYALAAKALKQRFAAVKR